VGLTETAVEWVQAVFAGYEVLGLVLVAFTESVVSPVPPDPLLAVLAEPVTIPRALVLAGATTLASVAGGTLAYWIGDRFSEWAHRRFADPRLDRVERWYQEHGEWVVAVAAVTPVPFKVFTIASGLLQLRFWPFAIAATVGRGARFALVAVLATFYGEQVVAWVDTYEIPLAILGLVLLAAIYVWTRYRETSSSDPSAEAPEKPG
jgi:undecaprenyl-diphosphatase